MPFLLSIDIWFFLTLHEQLQLNRRLKCIMHNCIPNLGPIDLRYGLTNQFKFKLFKKKNNMNLIKKKYIFKILS
jgi:hypothetical protein